MARTKAAQNATGRPLPGGVSSRGPAQYRARKLIDGRRVTKTFETARRAREWLEDTGAKVRAGEHRDLRPLDAITVGQLIERYAAERMQDRPQDRGHLPAIQNDTVAALKLQQGDPGRIPRLSSSTARFAGLSRSEFD